ncbi:hypothetical protein PRZ48_009930 [Zasmidium cellare]|uniref:Vacuolar protein-sorting-associated protein 36 n=1 Tax=Zasmidium cellare TaxID=395010 RepID=A0ABR0EDT4_ZASCE|nr:hypothetical protein PRZ48_009930 [Zasmidium cellare]
MFLRHLDLTTALRPSLYDDETLLFVQDSVGLYEGKYKIPNYQNGHAYLTSHRVCYVDNGDPRKYSVAINLKEIERSEFYAGFLKSSPKITLFPKAAKKGASAIRSPVPRYASPSDALVGSVGSSLPTSTPSPAPARDVNATWVCSICGMSNQVPTNFDPATANEHTPLPPCQACGIKPPLVTMVKAAITDRRVQAVAEDIQRTDSPGPSLDVATIVGDDTIQTIKFSFRDGGAPTFNERLQSALVQRKWLLQSAPPVPKPASTPPQSNGFSRPGNGTAPPTSAPQRVVGIAGLEQRGALLRQNNQAVIGTAFEDLEALMTSAKEVIEMAEQFAKQTNGAAEGDPDARRLISDSASALGLVTTKDMLGTGSSAEQLYVTELSRDLAEFLTDDRKGVLRKEGGIISLVDLWQVFNRTRNGIELVSPLDFEKSATMWDTLHLPVRLRRFKSGLLVVQERSRTDDKTIASLLTWLKQPQHGHLPPAGDDQKSTFGKGVTAQETAERFGWSVGVATEELEMAEEAGALCRDQCLDGIRFWENHFLRMVPGQAAA